MEEQLLKLEAEIEEKRIQIGQLKRSVFEAPAYDKRIVEGRLAFIQAELDSMYRQLDILRTGMRQQGSAQSANSPKAGVQPQGSIPPQMAQSQPYMQQNGPQFQRMAPPLQTHKKDWEKTIGKFLMGIFGAVLIFISIVLFAAVVFPKLGDGVKQVCMYTVSLAFLAAGLLRLKKDAKSYFNQAVTGCGFGGFYISLLISAFYFHSINEFVLFGGVFAWAVAICLFSKVKSVIFKVIGWVGIDLSVILGCTLCIEQQDTARLFWLIGFFLITAAVYFLAHAEKQLSKNFLGHIGLFLGMAALFFAIDSVFVEGGGFLAANGIVAVFALLILAASGKFEQLKGKDNYEFACLYIGYAIYLCGVTDALFADAAYAGAAALFVCIALWVVAEYKLYGKKDASLNLLLGILLVLLFVQLERIPLFDAYLGTSIFVAVFFAAGYFLKKTSYQVYGLIYLGAFVLYLGGMNLNDFVHCILGLLLFAGLLWFLYYAKEQYQPSSKVAAYILFVLFLWRDFYVLTDEGNLVAILVSGLNLVAMKSFLVCHPVTKEREKGMYGLTIAFNAIHMLVMSYVIAHADGAVHFLAILIGIAVFMVNTHNILQKYKQIWAGIYVGAKSTFLLIIILNSFDAADYMVSIWCLLAAVACIVLGFYGRYKSMRMYGLILAIVSVVKLVMVDVHYDNTLSHAASFFVAGGLVFAINLIYNYIDKKVPH